MGINDYCYKRGKYVKIENRKKDRIQKKAAAEQTRYGIGDRSSTDDVSCDGCKHDVA